MDALKSLKSVCFCSVRCSLLLSRRDLRSVATKQLPQKSAGQRNSIQRETRPIKANKRQLPSKSVRSKSRSPSSVTKTNGRMNVREQTSSLKTHQMNIKQPFERISSGDREINIDAKGDNPAFDVNRMASFKALNLRDDVLQALDSIQVSQPTVVQFNWNETFKAASHKGRRIPSNQKPLLEKKPEKTGRDMPINSILSPGVPFSKMLAIPAILQGRPVFCAAQTGSGKTLAYLTPIVNTLREEEVNGLITRTKHPRACIVVPGRELAVQVLKVAKSLSHIVPLRSLGLIGGRRRKWMREGLLEPVDILVATPKMLAKFGSKGKFFYTDLRYLVIDEADTMLDPGFKQGTFSLLQHVKAFGAPSEGSKRTQCVFSAATLPKKGVQDVLTDMIPGLKIVTAGLHRVLPHVKHTFIKSLQMEKKDRLVQFLQKNLDRPGRKFMIFTQTTETCDWLSYFLDENQIKNIRLHSGVSSQDRYDHLSQFQRGDAKVLVCTDSASRGLDTSDVSHVINYDFPSQVMDYIHRAGRTGRARVTYEGTGEVISYLSHNRHVIMARKIQMAAEKNKSLEDVNMRPEKKTLSTAKTNGDPGLIKAATVESNVVHKQS